MSTFIPGFGRIGWCAALWLAIASARAVQMIPLPVETLTKHAELVFQGAVLSKECLRDPSGGIFTKVRFQLIDVWKGNASSGEIEVVQSGGALGDEQVAVPGQAEFAVGEEVVCFVARNERGEWLVLGLAQGKFEVWRDDSGEKLAANPFHGTGRSTFRGARGAKLTLHALKNSVRRAVE